MVISKGQKRDFRRSLSSKFPKKGAKGRKRAMLIKIRSVALATVHLLESPV